MYVKTDDLLLNRYKILSKLGSGGFSDVYKAFDTKMERDVAIKQIHVSRHTAPRVLREARTVALLNHPNIVTLHEFEEDGNECYLIMELIEGVPLSKLLERLAPLSTDEAIVVATQICRALEAAHQHGIIHRDVKPENVMILYDGRLKVMDFGIARLKGTAETTASGDIIGTFTYMSPEQARGEIVDERSDIFSLGTVLYEMLTDSLPFNGETATETLNLVQNLKPDPPSDINPEIDEDVDACVMRALEKNPRERYASATEFRTNLEGCRADDTSTEQVLSGLITEYVGLESKQAWAEEYGWRGRMWFFLNRHREVITRTSIALLLAAPFFPILTSWFSWPHSLAVFGAAAVFLMVLLQPNYGVGITLFLLSVATIKHSVGLFLVLLVLLAPYWALVVRRWPTTSIWPAGGAIFGLMRIPFVFPVLAGLLAGPIAAAFIGGVGCVVFELFAIFLRDSIAPEIVKGYDVWSLIQGQANPLYVVQLMSGPFLENRVLIIQPLLWALIASAVSFVSGGRRWFAAAIVGFTGLVIGYQGLFLNFKGRGFDMGTLMQALSFSLIILLLLPIFRPPADDGGVETELPDELGE